MWSTEIHLCLKSVRTEKPFWQTIKASSSETCGPVTLKSRGVKRKNAFGTFCFYPQWEQCLFLIKPSFMFTSVQFATSAPSWALEDLRELRECSPQWTVNYCECFLAVPQLRVSGSKHGAVGLLPSKRLNCTQAHMRMLCKSLEMEMQPQ